MFKRFGNREEVALLRKRALAIREWQRAIGTDNQTLKPNLDKYLNKVERYEGPEAIYRAYDRAMRGRFDAYVRRHPELREQAYANLLRLEKERDLRLATPEMRRIAELEERVQTLEEQTGLHR